MKWRVQEQKAETDFSGPHTKETEIASVEL